jgi:hypothetical protein
MKIGFTGRQAVCDRIDLQELALPSPAGWPVRVRRSSSTAAARKMLMPARRLREELRRRRCSPRNRVREVQRAFSFGAR